MDVGRGGARRQVMPDKSSRYGCALSAVGALLGPLAAAPRSYCGGRVASWSGVGVDLLRWEALGRVMWAVSLDHASEATVWVVGLL